MPTKTKHYTMKAAFYKSFGAAAEVLEFGDIKLGKPHADEVQLQLYSSGINPSDVKKRMGQRGEFTDEFVVPHSDGAGIITAVGSNVDPDRIGERVWVHSAQHERHWGTAATAANLPAQLASRLPDACSFAEGACIGIPMMTAHRCLTIGNDIAGKNVLVTGAQGRVGYYAIQIAKHYGAHVIATVGAKSGQEAARAIGADYVVSHRDDAFPEQIMEHLGGAHLHHVVDVEFGINLTKYLPALSDHAIVSSYASGVSPTPELPFYPLMFKNVSIHPVLVYSMPEQAIARAIEDINQMLEQKVIRFQQITEFTLEDIVKAHESIERGGRGHTVLNIV